MTEFNTEARINIVHWTCGDGCCSDTEYTVEWCWSEYTFSSFEAAADFCEQKGWSYRVVETYPDDV